MRLLRGTALFLTGVALGAGGIALATSGVLGKTIHLTSKSKGTPVFGIYPTGVGLPLVGAPPPTTVGAGDYAGVLKSYHESGNYSRDVNAIDRRAATRLTSSLSALRTRQLRCPGEKGQRKQACLAKKQARQAICQAQQAAHYAGIDCPKKPAMVLDIDDTSLSNYNFIAPFNFQDAPTHLFDAVLAAQSPVLKPTLKLFDEAKSHGVAVFFLSGRPQTYAAQTTANLTAAGYRGWKGLILKTPGSTQNVIPYKSAARASIEKKGYEILVNVGDQESDLAGGHADAAYKIPNPFYFIP